MRTLIAITKLLFFALWTLLMVTAQLFILPFSKASIAYVIPHAWHKGVCRIFNIHVTTSGQPSTTAPSTLYISNHISWLDIPVIGSKVKASFVAKREVESWPLFGFLSKLQQTAFIDRSRNAALREKNSLKNELSAGKNLILFPEGTSSNGSEVLPFKSSLFEILRSENTSDKIAITLQPFCITIKSINGSSSKTQKQLDIYAWYGDMDLAPHLWAFSKSKGAEIHLSFLPAIPLDTTIDRKKTAKQAYSLISQSFQGITK